MSEGAPPAASASRGQTVPRRWTLHGLNNGLIFAATYHLVSLLPRPVSYAIGHVGTWLAWWLMPNTRLAVADNLRAIFPAESASQLERRALTTLRSYARDVIDFLRALKTPPAEARRLFEARPQDLDLFNRLLADGRGLILVTGHYGNWEVGSVFMRHVFGTGLTIPTQLLGSI